MIPRWLKELYRQAADVEEMALNSLSLSWPRTFGVMRVWVHASLQMKRNEEEIYEFDVFVC